MPLSSLLSFSHHSQLSPAVPVRTLPIGIRQLDELTGGIRRATLNEIRGEASSGRATLLLSILRESTRSGECCVCVDVQDSFDPASALLAGVELPRLLWVRCGGNVDYALKATDLLIRAGGFGLVVMDLCGAPYVITRRISLTSWFRLRHGAEQSGAALVVMGENFHAGSCSKLQLELCRRQNIWSERLLRGLEIVAGLGKRDPMRSTAFRIAW